PPAPADTLPAATASDATPAVPEQPAETPSSDGQPPEAVREVVWEETRFKYVAWADYREGPARQWDEVPWIRYQAYMTRKELVDRFGAKGRKVTLDHTPKGSEEQAEKTSAPPDAYKKAIVHEIWDKT